MSKKSLTKLARERAKKTGESYATARTILERKAEAFTPEQVDDALDKLTATTTSDSTVRVEVRSYELVDVEVKDPADPIAMIAPGPFMTWRRTVDRTAWQFSGIVYLMEHELADGERDLEGWLRRRIGRRCLSVAVQRRDGHRVRVVITAEPFITRITHPTRVLSDALKRHLRDRLPQFGVYVVEGGLLPANAPVRDYPFPSHQIYIHEAGRAHEPRSHIEVRADEADKAETSFRVHLWIDEDYVDGRRLDLRDRQMVSQFCVNAVASFVRWRLTPTERQALVGDTTYFRFHADYETSERAGAGGTFQVITIEDEAGRELTDVLGIELGTHYPDGEELKRHIARNLGLRSEAIELDEV
ncbi:MAG: hypothetical protein U0441_23085 [Polyangiaceae bacterium]